MMSNKKKTMSNKKIAAAAKLLLDARARQTTIAGLPDACRPATAEQAYAIQDAVAFELGPIGGWKVGAKGISDEPTCAPLPAATVMAGPGKLASGLYPLRGIEAEIAFRLRHDLPSREQPYTLAEVLDAVGSVHPAIEVVESRYTDRTQADPLSGLADAASHGALIYGDGRCTDLAIKQSEQTAELYFDAQQVVHETGANPAVDVLRLLVWLANHVASRHDGLKAGQIVTTGSCTGLLFVGPTAQVSALLPGLGQADLSFHA